MQDFWLYFQLGRDHIADWKGYDHILFVTALCLRYILKDWKKVLILVTAFTIGHSITLALSVLSYVSVSVAWIEFLIPLTIAITAISNIWQKEFQFKTRFPTV
jgi:HupE / UreJ protein